jgi:hypothetical protein
MPSQYRHPTSAGECSSAVSVLGNDLAGRPSTKPLTASSCASSPSPDWLWRAESEGHRHQLARPAEISGTSRSSNSWASLSRDCASLFRSALSCGRPASSARRLSCTACSRLYSLALMLPPDSEHRRSGFSATHKAHSVGVSDLEQAKAGPPRMLRLLNRPVGIAEMTA